MNGGEYFQRMQDCQPEIAKRVDVCLRVAKALLHAFWPPQCVLCGRAGQPPAQDLCAGCEADLPLNANCCSVCAVPLASGDAVCGACLEKRPRFDACFAPYRYAYPLDHMVRRLKYAGAVAHGRVLGDLFAEQLEQRDRQDRPELLLPVPLGPARFRRRGYNQAVVLAEQIARRTGIQLQTDALVRTRDTLEQAGLDRRARRKNMRGAFALLRPLHAAHVAIVDDVVTTGSTANELTRVLKRAGVERVEVWAIARAARNAG